MHAALLGDLPAAGAGVKPLLQWQDAHRRRLMGSAAGARACRVVGLSGALSRALSVPEGALWPSCLLVLCGAP